jgi:putative FmdB family regulatory protein
MPIYEFQCQSCGNEIEIIQKISDSPLTDCEACGKPDMKKMVSAAAFRLSGSGWYETDFKKGAKKNLTAKNDDKPDAKTPDKKSDKKTNKTESKKSESKTTAKKK